MRGIELQQSALLFELPIVAAPQHQHDAEPEPREERQVTVGTATVTVTENGIDGLFDGRVRLIDRFSHATLGDCQAADHRLVFMR